MAKIIATIGPNSNNSSILGELNKKVDYFRINMSHTDERDIELRVKELLPYDVPIILDTEGPQVRSGNIYRLNFNEGDQVDFPIAKVMLDKKEKRYFFEIEECDNQAYEVAKKRLNAFIKSNPELIPNTNNAQSLRL